MSEEYLLKLVTAKDLGGDTYALSFQDGTAYMNVAGDDLRKEFVPLSVREQQIREALEPLLCYWQQVDPYTSEYEGEELLDECVAAILGIEGAER